MLTLREKFQSLITDMAGKQKWIPPITKDKIPLITTYNPEFHIYNQPGLCTLRKQ